MTLKKIICLKISGLFGFVNKTNCQDNQWKCHIGDRRFNLLVVTNTNLNFYLLVGERWAGTT